jgi:hypothetical protein
MYGTTSIKFSWLKFPPNLIYIQEEQNGPNCVSVRDTTPNTLACCYRPVEGANGLCFLSDISIRDVGNTARHVLEENKFCDMIWYGMVWCMIYYGMIRYGMVWYGMVWYSIIYDMILYMIWCDIYHMIWYNMVYDIVWYDIIYDMVWYDMIHDMVWYDMIYDMVWNEIIYDMIYRVAQKMYTLFTQQYLWNKSVPPI